MRLIIIYFHIDMMDVNSCIHDVTYDFDNDFRCKIQRQECLGNTIRSDQVMILLACNIRITIGILNLGL